MDSMEEKRALDWFRPTADGQILGGLELDELLSRSRVDPAANALTADQHFLMMLNSIDITDDECHGLAERPMRPGFSGVGLRAMLGASTLASALRVLARYYEAPASVFRLEVREGDGLARIALRAEGEDRARAAMLEEIWLMALHMFMGWFVGRRLPLLAVTVARPDHPDLGGDHWALGAPLGLDPVTSLVTPLACLGLARRAGDVEEPIWEAMRFSMDEFALPAGEGLLGAAMSASETPARTRLRDAFNGLALCDRQLSRRIRREHGVTFRDLRGEALAALARELLRNSDLPIYEIGARLGYAEERSFRRFMRQRTGFTPAQIRRGAFPPADPEARALLHSLVQKLQV
ncbi:MAG: AraC family transcriptional regulator ligand-binding domain-containing protein [Caulobacteraceae bacterium]